MTDADQSHTLIYTLKCSILKSREGKGREGVRVRGKKEGREGCYELTQWTFSDYTQKKPQVSCSMHYVMSNIIHKAGINQGCNVSWEKLLPFFPPRVSLLQSNKNCIKVTVL